jgi:diguanylate cyclase (GGDEF)-like protein
MSRAVLAVDEERPGARALPADVAQRRLGQRREMLVLQALSYVLGDIVLWIYACAGTVPLSIPLSFLLCGIGLTGLFALLSEFGIGDRFDDHFLTTSQSASNIVLQLGFLLAAPEIGFLFLSVLFVIFGFASLRMTSREAIILWALTGTAVAAMFLLLKTPIALPMATTAEWLAATFSFAVTIGQCAYIGLFGSTMRKSLHQRTVELKLAYQRIEELAQTDELTGLPNRRSMVRMLDEEIARGQRGTPCSVAMIDIDWFKRINDGYGHAAGDEVLRTLAITVFANIRTNDRFGRYGGEEFLLVLPDTPREEAGVIVERLRAMVAEIDWNAFAIDRAVTISAGLATLAPDDSSDDILARADRALYAAKAGGRNRIATDRL